jgi:excisionase family DNA binding protein
MKRRVSVEERRDEANRAAAELDALPVEPISVRIATAVKLTGIPRTTLYELIKSGEIETIKIGRSTFIPYRCLRRLVGG